MDHEHPAWELGMSLFLIALGLAVIALSASFPKMDDGQPGPALFPQLLSAGLIVGGLSLAWSSARDLRRAGHGPVLASRAGLAKVGVTLVLAAAVPLVMPAITLTGAAGLAAAAFCIVIGTDAARSLGVGVFTAATVYFVFGRLLGVPLS